MGLFFVLYVLCANFLKLRLSGEDKLLLQYNYILLLFWDIGITFDILHGISC